MHIYFRVMLLDLTKRLFSAGLVETVVYFPWAFAWLFHWPW